MTAPAPRILEVLYSFRVGGSELVGLELARQLVASGAEVYCAAIDAGPGPAAGTMRRNMEFASLICAFPREIL